MSLSERCPLLGAFFSPVQGEHGLCAPEVDEAFRYARILQDICEQRGDEAVEELLRGRDAQPRKQHHARVVKFLEDRIVPAVEGVVGERVCGQVGDEEGLAVGAKLPEAVHDFQSFHPLDDRVLVALLSHVHLAGHPVVEELRADDGELLKGGVADREYLDLVMVHLRAHVEELHDERRTHQAIWCVCVCVHRHVREECVG